MRVCPQTEDDGQGPPALSSRTKPLENDKNEDHIKVPEQDHSRPKRDGCQKAAEEAGDYRCFEVSARSPAKVEQKKKYRLHEQQPHQCDTDESTGAPGNVERHLRQPFVVHPILAADCERVHVMVGQVMGLEEILGVAQMPPDVGIVQASGGENPEDTNQQQRQ